MKDGKIWSVSLEHFVEPKHLILEECLLWTTIEGKTDTHILNFPPIQCMHESDKTSKKSWGKGLDCVQLNWLLQLNFCMYTIIWNLKFRLVSFFFCTNGTFLVKSPTEIILKKKMLWFIFSILSNPCLRKNLALMALF